MYPSKNPMLYVLQMLTVACAIMFGMYYGCVILREPLSLLLILGLHYIPEFPLVPEGDQEDEDDEPLYDGDPAKPVGFAPQEPR